MRSFFSVFSVLLFLPHAWLATTTSVCPSDCTCTTEFFNCKDVKLTSMVTKFSSDVRSVDLSVNQIKNLTAIPEGSSLTFLNLSSNGIETIMYDAFDNLDNLKTLVLSNNSISRVTDDIFEWNPLQLQELRLDHNRLEYVQHFLLYDLEKLQIVYLNNNNISFIHPHAFTQLKNLNELHLDHNQLYTFDPKWLKGLHANMFKTITVSDNRWSCDCAMQAATKWLKKKKWIQPLLKDFTCLNHTKGNQVAILSATKENGLCQNPTITGISSSTKLKAGQSIQLDCIVKDTFPHPSIVWVAPSTDRYSYHTADRFEGIEAFSNGSIIIHQFTGKDSGVYSCTATNGKSTVMANTTIVVGNNTAHVTKIVTKSAKTSYENHVEHQNCPDECQCMSRHIDCSSEGTRKLSKTPATDQFDKNVLTISYANNVIQNIPSDAFSAYTKLEELRLDNNKISNVDDGAFNIAALSTLTMRDNELARVSDGLFGNLKKLTILVLDNNRLVEIGDGLFKGLRKLQWLYVRNNQIKTISKNAFQSLKQVRFIHLEGNELKSLSVETFSVLTNLVPRSLKEVFVEDNTFVCDCQMTAMQQFVKDSKNQIFGDGIQCSFPIDLDGTYLAAVPYVLNCTAGELTTINIEKTNSSGAMSALWFGGLILGVMLTILALVVWKKWRCRIGGPAVSYSNVPGYDDASEHAAIMGNKSGGSEAFV